MEPDKDLTRREFAGGGVVSLAAFLAGCTPGAAAGTVAIAEPPPGAIVAGDVRCRAWIAGAAARRMEFWVDGVLRHSRTSPPYEWTWPTCGERDGTHRLVARARLRDGSARSDAMSLTVRNAVAARRHHGRVYYGGRNERTGRRTMTAPIRGCPRLHPESDAFRGQLKQTAEHSGGWTLSLAKWTCPVYFADSSTPRITVGPIRYAPDYDHRYLKGVPMPASVVPDPGDFHLAVYDLEHGIAFEFYGWMEDEGYMCRQACQLPLFRSDGWAPYGWGTTDSGANATTGTIWPDELAAGWIPHALKGAIGAVDPSYTILPATNASGSRPGAPPYGVRIQLDPSLDLDGVRLPGDPACLPDGSLKAWQKTIARCLQTYGWYVSDQGGVGIGAVNVQSFSENPYRAIPDFDAGATEEQLPVGLIDRFRFLDGPRIPAEVDRAAARIPDLLMPGAASWSAEP